MFLNLNLRTAEMNTVFRPLKSEPLGRHVGAIHELPAWYAKFIVHRKIFDICKIVFTFVHTYYIMYEP